MRRLSRLPAPPFGRNAGRSRLLSPLFGPTAGRTLSAFFAGIVERSRQWRSARSAIGLWMTALVRQWRKVLAIVCWFIAVAVIVTGTRFWRAGRMLVALSRLGAAPAAASAHDALIERELSIAGRNGPIRARLYRRPDVARGPGLVVVHGVHYRGIDERRLIPFARELARAGRVVLTPELDDLIDYRITSRGVATITDATRWLSDEHSVVDNSRVGLLGFSFAGGLALVVAGEPELDGRVAYVTSVGGHHDLSRVLRFLLTNDIDTPEGIVHQKAHEYGLAVIVYMYIDELVPTEDRPILRDAFRAYLHEDFASAASIAVRRTTPEGERLYARLMNGKLQELRPDLERLLSQRSAELAALSPRGRLGRVHAPVYLLHGSADSVIPSSETRWAELELGTHEHEALVSPLLEHVEVSHPAGIGQEIALVSFMAKLL